jgi:hypothetical protein
VFLSRVSPMGVGHYMTTVLDILEDRDPVEQIANDIWSDMARANVPNNLALKATVELSALCKVYMDAGMEPVEARHFVLDNLSIVVAQGLHPDDFTNWRSRWRRFTATTHRFWKSYVDSLLTGMTYHAASSSPAMQAEVELTRARLRGKELSEEHPAGT